MDLASLVKTKLVLTNPLISVLKDTCEFLCTAQTTQIWEAPVPRTRPPGPDPQDQTPRTRP